MAQYRVKQRSFIGGQIVEEGETVEFDGKPGKYLEPIVVERAKPEQAKGKQPRAEDMAG